jgi:hypothetical protein
MCVLDEITIYLFIFNSSYKGLSTNGIADESIIVSSTEEGYNKNVSNKAILLRFE